MEPTAGLVSWGRPAWSFLHGVTLDPLAKPPAKQAQKQLMDLLRYILPCPTCRESYRQFSKNLDQVPAEHIGDWVIDIHDRVNLKLDKPAADEPAAHWKDFQLHQFARNGYASYVEDMFFFFFTLAANYPLTWTQNTQVAEKYRDFFETAAPTAMAHRPWGKSMQKYLESHPLDLSGREELMQWLYGMFTAVMPAPHPTMETIQETMALMRK